MMINAAVTRVRAGLVEGLTLTALRVQEIAVPRTPIDTGDLRSSLAVTPATQQTLESAVSTGLPYAVRQHEDLGYRHRAGGPKYLESAALDVRVEMGRIISAAVQRAAGGGA